MNILLLLIPIAILLGLAGLAAFIWALNSGQFEDPDGQGWRVLQENEDLETGPK